MQFEPGTPLETDPARMIPELLDRLASLGDFAKEVSRALGGNGHRAGVTAELIKEMATCLVGEENKPNSS